MIQKKYCQETPELSLVLTIYLVPYLSNSVLDLVQVCCPKTDPLSGKEFKSVLSTMGLEWVSIQSRNFQGMVPDCIGLIQNVSNAHFRFIYFNVAVKVKKAGLQDRSQRVAKALKYAFSTAARELGTISQDLLSIALSCSRILQEEMSTEEVYKKIEEHFN